MNEDEFVYQPVDSSVPVRAHERHTAWVAFRLSPRLHRELVELADREETSVSEVVREALAKRWGLK